MTQFKNIIDAIGYRANAWQVTDPIGQYLVFETSSIDGDAGASYDAEKNTLNWNLRQATKNSNGEYVMTYTVKLDTLAQGIALDTTQETFTSNQYYKANGVTSLEYYLLDAKGSYIDDDEKLIEDFTNGKFLQTMYFNVPAVKGYKADLTFKKVDDAGNPISDVAFTLALNESGKTWANQPANDVKSDANGVVTFTNIPSGHSYILTEETVPDGYSAASKTVGFDVAYGEIANHNFTDANNELTVVNTRDNGSLTFTKKFAETSDITASNWPADKTIAFAIKDADGNTKNVTLPVKNEDGTYSWTTTVSGLATGKATVTETITAIDGYTAAKVEDVTVNVTTKETVAAEIINTYTRNNGKVSVSKSFADLPEDLRNEITITLTPVAEEGNTATETKTIVLNKGNDWAAKDVVIPTGKYTVTESGADVKDYGFAPEWTVDGKVTKEPIEITVNKDGSIALAVKNTYTKHTGTLTIKKTLNGVTLEQAKGTTFTVNGVDYTLEDFTLENGVYTKQVILPVGEYEVVETNADVAGYDRVTVPTDEKNGKHSQTVTIQKDGNAEAAFTNTYTQKKGKLVVEKTFEVLNAAQLDALDKSKVAFTVTNVRTVSGASVEPVTVTLDKFTQDGSKFTYEMANLLIGTYEVTESATVTVPNFEAVKVTYTPENESQTAATVNVTDEGTATVTASVTNTYTRKDAQSVSFKLTKILKKLGDVAPSFDDFQFELTASIAPVQTNVLRAAPALNDNEISVVGSDNVITVTKAAEGVYTLTISDVPVGETGKSGFVTVYANADEIGRLQMTLKEITTDTDTDWTFDTREYTYSNDKWTYVNEAGETVAEDNPSFTNKYSKNLADLTITKILSGAEAAYPESVQFTVSGVEEPVTLNAANNWTSTIEDLVPGNYTVTEVVVDPDYYDVTTKVDGVESTTKMVPLDYNDVVTVKYENIYTQTPAAAQSVKVIKKIEEGAISAPAQTFKFVGVLTENADGVSTMALVDAKHANVNVGGKTYTNIAFGTPFEFEIATSGKNANGYEETIAIDVNGEDLDNLYLTVAEVVPEDTGYWAYDLETKTIKVAAGAKVEFTNKYNEGYITTQIPVTKTVAQAGNIVPGVNTFYFNAWLVYGDIAPDAEEATMHVKGDMAVDCGNGVFSITVNGANAETAVVEVTYPESVVPKAILLYEMAGSEDKLTKDELAAAGWIYDKSAETYTDETGANHYYWRYFFETGKMSDTDFVAVDEINITNTYTASTPPPKTGDNSNIALWLALMSASALCFVLISKRRSA